MPFKVLLCDFCEYNMWLAYVTIKKGSKEENKCYFCLFIPKELKQTEYTIKFVSYDIFKDEIAP